jgi:hypothetical protein
MGIQNVSYLPGIQLPEKQCRESKNGDPLTLFVKYSDHYIEKISISAETTSEELSRTLLALCGITYEEDLKGMCLSLSKPNGLQIVGVLEGNSNESPYEIRIVEDNSVKKEIQKQIELLRTKVLRLDMDKIQCDGSLYVLSDQIKTYKEYYKISPETSEWLKSPTFNNWEFEDNELVSLVLHMYQSLGIPAQFDIDLQTLFNFVHKVREHYNHNPFHNFKHAFCVSQMAYALIHRTGFVNHMTMLEKFILITACLGHDLDHPGYNNAYQVNAKTDLAIIYNDQSPLENHHAAMLFAILRLESCNLFKNMAQEHIAIVRKSIIRTIMATDMAKHGESLSAFKKISEAFSFQEAEHRSQLLCILIKCADISTEVRPPTIAGTLG